MRPFEIRKNDVNGGRGWNSLIDSLIMGDEEFIIDETVKRNTGITLSSPRYLARAFMDNSGQYVLTALRDNQNDRWLRREEAEEYLRDRLELRCIPGKVEVPKDQLSREQREIERLMRQKVGIGGRG